MPAGPRGASACPRNSAVASVRDAADLALCPGRRCAVSVGDGGNARFPRGYRLTRPSEFDRVFRSARVRSRHGVIRLFAVSNDLSTARLGLVVGKRAVPRAHDRNRAKRVLRETFRRRRRELPSMDIVVQVTGPAGKPEYRAALESLLARLS